MLMEYHFSKTQVCAVQLYVRYVVMWGTGVRRGNAMIVICARCGDALEVAAEIANEYKPEEILCSLCEDWVDDEQEDFDDWGDDDDDDW